MPRISGHRTGMASNSPNSAERLFGFCLGPERLLTIFQQVMGLNNGFNSIDRESTLPIPIPRPGFPATLAGIWRYQHTPNQERKIQQARCTEESVPAVLFPQNSGNQFIGLQNICQRVHATVFLGFFLAAACMRATVNAATVSSISTIFAASN